MLPIYKAQRTVSIILAKRYGIVMFHVKQLLPNAANCGNLTSVSKIESLAKEGISREF